MPNRPPALPPRPPGRADHPAARGPLRIAKDTWAFYEKDVDPNTHLPLDNLGPGDARGTYTSAANIGVYLWAVVAAGDMHLISRAKEVALVKATLTEVQSMRRTNGMLYQWYDTTTGESIKNPGDINCSEETTPAQDNCWFLSAVDNGWYASGLVVARQALPQVRGLATSLLGDMDFSIFYDAREQKDGCNTNPDLAGQPADRADVRRLLRRARPRGLSQRRPLQRPADRHVPGHGAAPDAG